MLRYVHTEVAPTQHALDDPRAEDGTAGNFSSYTFTFDHVYSGNLCARLPATWDEAAVSEPCPVHVLYSVSSIGN